MTAVAFSSSDLGVVTVTQLVTSPGTISAGTCQRWFHLVGEGWWRVGVGVEGGGVGGWGPKLKLQALVFDKVLPPTATLSYVIGLQQLTVFFVGAEMAVTM